MDLFYWVGLGDFNLEEVLFCYLNVLFFYWLFVMFKGEINISELGFYYLIIGCICKDVE